jgi:chorismate dehydratase
MIRLGHIEYSNCFPVHALLVDRPPPPDVELVRGTPAGLNAALELGAIDVAPCSSIEFARHPHYRVLPDFAIASDGPVRSILLESSSPPESLDGVTVGVPTASATSVVLLRLLLELRYGVRVQLRWFDQATTDPFADGAAAALWIGDRALARPGRTARRLLDLGEAWSAWTGLPFVYAVWQTNLPATRDAELQRLYALLHASHAYFLAHAPALANRHADEFGIAADRLLVYWRSLRYTLDERAERGLLHFFALAARLGEAPDPRGLRRVHVAGHPHLI